MKWIILFKQVTIIYYFFFSLSLVSSKVNHRRVKKLINGDPVDSLETYDLQFVVALRSSWACTGSIEHDFSDCTSVGHCTGSLITPDFVLTACHCTSWDDVEVDNFWWLRFWRPYHPLYNGIIIRAGTASTAMEDFDIPNAQTRHVMAFLPHSLCNFWTNRRKLNIPLSHDIALAKACEPFIINKHVNIAPRSSFNFFEDEYRSVLKKGKACLWAGYGNIIETEEDVQPPNTLHYGFRFVTCSGNCEDPVTICKICSIHVGPKLMSTGFGDSGCPIICDGNLFAVHSASWMIASLNFSDLSDTPLFCIRDYLTPKHLNNLKKLVDSKENKMETIPYGLPHDSVPNARYPRSPRGYIMPHISRLSTYSSVESAEANIFTNILMLLSIWSSLFRASVI